MTVRSGDGRLVLRIRLIDAAQVGHDLGSDVLIQSNQVVVGHALLNDGGAVHEQLIEHVGHVAGGERSGLVSTGLSQLSHGEVDAEVLAAEIPPPDILGIALAGTLIDGDGGVDHVSVSAVVGLLLGETGRQAQNHHQSEKHAKQFLHEKRSPFQILRG